MAISSYSTTASSNTALFPEGMNPASVNNNMRQVQADIRSWYETPQWRDLGHTVAYASTTTFTIASNVTSSYIAGQRIRCTDSSTLYGSIVSSSYSAPNTTVTVTLDSGNLSASLTAVALGIDPTNTPIPYTAIKGGVSLTGTNAFTGVNSFSNTTTFTGKVIAPNDGTLTIASGAITVTGVLHTVDTEASAASDDLDTINGGADGQLLTIRTVNSSRDVVITNAGNIVTPNGTSFTLKSTSETASFIYDGTLSKWLVASVPTQIIAGTGMTVSNPTGISTITGKVIQRQVATDATMTSGTAQIPNDDTIPQNTEGLQAITCSITPTNSSNTLYIRWQVNCASNGSNEVFAAALFQDSTANALHVVNGFSSVAGDQTSLFGEYYMTAGTTSSTTFKIRVGTEDSTTVTLNGSGGARKYGGVLAHKLIVEELS